MKKTFDCVEMKRELQENLWVEAGETFEGLLKLLDKKRENNTLLKELLLRKEKQATIA
jgi:hypothetical protein